MFLHFHAPSTPNNPIPGTWDSSPQIDHLRSLITIETRILNLLRTWYSPEGVHHVRPHSRLNTIEISHDQNWTTVQIRLPRLDIGLDSATAIAEFPGGVLAQDLLYASRAITNTPFDRARWYWVMQNRMQSVLKIICGDVAFACGSVLSLHNLVAWTLLNKCMKSLITFRRSTVGVKHSICKFFRVYPPSC